MSDFEDRLRGELADAAAPLGSTPGLRGEVDRRVRHHRRVRRAQLVVGAAGMLLVMVGVGVFLESDDQGNEPQTFANPTAVTVSTALPFGPESMLAVPPFRSCDPSSVDPGITVPPIPPEVLDQVPEESIPGRAELVDDASRYVGLGEQAAFALAADENRVARVVCRDGASTDAPLDFVEGRVDLAVVGGAVVEAFIESSGQASTPET